MAAVCYGRFQGICRSLGNSLKLRKVLRDTTAQISISPARYSSVKAQALVYNELGDPGHVLRLDFVDRNVIGPQSVGVHMIAAPINPSDINQIQGTYGIRPQLPAVGGNEGFGQVFKTGKEVEALKEGDFVILAQSALGSWSRYLVLSEKELIKIPHNVTIEFAATLAVNPCTAYRMLKDFADLEPGSTIIQNGANSGVGRAVIQLAAAWGIQTINIVRERPNLEELQKDLVDLGATHVVTDTFCRTPEMTHLMKICLSRRRITRCITAQAFLFVYLRHCSRFVFGELPKPRLGFNCVGGKSATELVRRLSQNGILVTYGGMSKQPFAVPTGSLIFNDIRLRGFWMTGWNENKTKSKARMDMIQDICQLHSDGKFQPPPCENHSLQDYKTAIFSAMQPFSSTKQLFTFMENSGAT